MATTAAQASRREVYDQQALKLIREALERLAHAEANAEQSGKTSVAYYGGSKYPAMVGAFTAICSQSANDLRLALTWLEAE